ncbi:hypothetical protein WJX82_007131 [Trebouxia sp. C0006]
MAALNSYMPKAQLPLPGIGGLDSRDMQRIMASIDKELCLASENVKRLAHGQVKVLLLSIAESSYTKNPLEPWSQSHPHNMDRIAHVQSSSYFTEAVQQTMTGKQCVGEGQRLRKAYQAYPPWLRFVNSLEQVLPGPGRCRVIVPQSKRITAGVARESTKASARRSSNDTIMNQLRRASFKTENLLYWYKLLRPTSGAGLFKVSVNSGLLLQHASGEELVFIIGHELEHGIAKHLEEEESWKLAKHTVTSSNSTPVQEVLYVPAFLTREEEVQLLQAVDAAPAARWIHAGERQMQNWGGRPGEAVIREKLPQFLQALVELLLAAGVYPLDQAPQHVLINSYSKAAGITPHMDGPLYSPCVATITLGGPALMAFHEVLPDGTQGQLATEVMLQPRCLLLMRGPVCSTHMHSILSQDADVLSESCGNLDAAHVHVILNLQKRSYGGGRLQ